MSTLERLTAILHRDYGVAREALTPAATLETLGLDSLSILELLFKIEDGFDLKIVDDPPPDLRTVGDVVRFIDGQLAHKESTAAGRPLGAAGAR